MSLLSYLSVHCLRKRFTVNSQLRVLFIVWLNERSFERFFGVWTMFYNANSGLCFRPPLPFTAPLPSPIPHTHFVFESCATNCRLNPCCDNADTCCAEQDKGSWPVYEESTLRYKQGPHTSRYTPVVGTVNLFHRTDSRTLCSEQYTLTAWLRPKI